jgi:transcriptional regulator with XRE-family HTH domain
MKTMNFEFLDNIAKQEIVSPLVYSSSDIDDNEMSPLGALIWNARKHMKLSYNEFASHCNIDVNDVISIEDDYKYSPDIRTLYSISDFLKINNGILAEIAGYIKVRDPLYQQKLYSFAASSRKIRDCTDEKVEIFEQYLAVLHERSANSG